MVNNRHFAFLLDRNALIRGSRATGQGCGANNENEELDLHFDLELERRLESGAPREALLPTPCRCPSRLRGRTDLEILDPIFLPAGDGLQRFAWWAQRPKR